MATITTEVPSFTAVPDISDPTTFEAKGNTFLNEINERYIAGNAQVLEINAVKDEMNDIKSDTIDIQNLTLQYSYNALGYSDTASIAKANAELANSNAQVAKTSAELAYSNTSNLVAGLVIPTDATYTYGAIDKKFNTKLRQFLNFKS